MEPGDIAAHIPVLPLPWGDVRHQPLRDFVFASDLQSAPQYSPYVVLPLGFGAFFNHSFEPNVCFWLVVSTYVFSIVFSSTQNTAHCHCPVVSCDCVCKCVHSPSFPVSFSTVFVIHLRLADFWAKHIQTSSKKYLNSHLSGALGSQSSSIRFVSL